MSRITRKELEVKVDYINHATIRPAENVIGHIAIDHYSPGMNPYQYKLVKIMENGGVSELTSCRMTIREFYSYLNGIVTGLDMMGHG